MHKPDLVEHVCVRCAYDVREEVAQREDGSAHSDNEALMHKPDLAEQYPEVDEERSYEVPENVVQRVDGPTHVDNEAQDARREPPYP